MCKCAYFKIPDPIVTAQKIKDRKNYMMVEEKRPFDGILVTPVGNFCIECKFNYHPLSTHQKDNLALIDSINDTGYVLRKIEKIAPNGYQIIYVKYRKEKGGKVIYETDSPLDLIKSFMNEQGTKKQENKEK